MPGRLVLFLLAASLAAVPVVATDVAETRATVPALTELHDVIYPLWHGAWPAKDLPLMRELLPEAQRGVERVENAQLPGILRDKQAAWEQSVVSLRQAVDAYGAAVAADQLDATLAAVEDFHARFEQLVRLIRPPMKELDAFHVVLYDVWHHLVPESRFAELPAAATELVTRCETLAAAQLPARAAALETEFVDAIAELCRASRVLQEVVTSDDPAAVEAAAETVHERYQAIEQLFESL